MFSGCSRNCGATLAVRTLVRVPMGGRTTALQRRVCCNRALGKAGGGWPQPSSVHALAALPDVMFALARRTWLVLLQR
jgi:hypothetical protein